MLTLAALGLPSLVPWGSAGSDVLAAEQAEHMMRTYVVGSGGAPTSSDHFRANGTVGQPTPIGIGTSSTRVVYAGFWGRRWALMGVEPPATYRNEFLQNYPNPFNPVTTIKYSIGSAGLVEIAIFDVEGRRIRTLVSEVEAPGAYTAVWDGRNDLGQALPNGIYFCRLAGPSRSRVVRLCYLR